MDASPIFFIYWRKSLLKILNWIEDFRDKTSNFYLKAFAVFVLLNFSCFWWALFTAYPDLVFGVKAREYVFMGFPVALLGGAFDSLSLLVTLFIIRRALISHSNSSYILYLSVDFLLAIIASLWVLFVFMVSGWAVSYILEVPETIGSRVWLYGHRVESAVYNPFNPNNIRNIYFGIIMGASALLPTLLHITIAGLSFLKSGSTVRGFMRPHP